ncbi:MAG: hypothetical protein ACK5PZ_13285 [Pirellula sp.]
MVNNQTKAILGSLCGGIGGGLIGIVVSGFLWMLRGIERDPKGPVAPFEPIFGLLDVFFGMAFALFFAAIGGVVGAAIGAGLATMSRDDSKIGEETHGQDTLHRGQGTPISSSDSQESLKSEVARLKERIAEIEGRARDN